MPRLRLSIVLATYNGANYLPVQLASLAGQSRPPDELVVCDDGSKDDTVARVEAFAASAPFAVRVHRQPANVGVNQNFATGLAMADGEVLFCCDQDDRWHPDKLARVAEVFERDPDVGLVLNDADLVDADLKPLGRTLWQQLNLDPAVQDRIEAGGAFRTFTLGMAIFGCTTAVRADLRRAFLPLPAKMPFDTWTGRIVSAHRPTRLVREALQDYRQHAAQAFGVGREPRWKRALALWRHSTAAAAQVEVDTLRAYADRLAALEPTAARRDSESLILERLRLSERRQAARRSLAKRVPLVARSLLDGSYGQAAQGWRSAVTDLIAPPERLV